MKIRVIWDKVEVTIALDDTPTAKKVWDALPCQSKSHTWGEEVYFKVPVQTSLEPGAQQIVDPGTACFWVEGDSIALPFGATPISKGEKSMLVAKVNIIGRIEGDCKVLKAVGQGDSVRLERVEE